MKAKKSLGQNFLKSKRIIEHILDESNLDKETAVLEIGPGKGILTESLLKRVKKVIAIEKDSRLIPILQEKFSEDIKKDHLHIISGDILEISSETLDGFLEKKYSIVANIPYYITGALLKKFLTTKSQPEKIIFLVQKEVAERILARDKKESILSLSIKAYGDPRSPFKVKKENFYPKPKVDSAVLCIENISKNFFEDISEENFFHILHTGFKSKRKMLKNNLQQIFGENTEKILVRLGIKSTERPENVDLKTWKNLTRTYEKHVPV